MGTLRRWLAAENQAVFLVVAAGGLAVGAAVRLAGYPHAAHAVWAAVTAAGILPAAWWVIAAARQRRLGVDVVALLALAGTIVVKEYLAGSVIAVMLATGRSLEAWAAGRARRELRLLIDRAPRQAHRYEGSAAVDVPVDAVVAGEKLLVKPGELVPVDGRVVSGVAVVDEAAMTGESNPLERGPGEPVRSGTVNAGGPFDMWATTTAGQSSYAAIVRLVASAQAATAPAVRLADRYAGGFLALSLAAAGAAWIGAGLARAVAVLVVATPCPLILAVPIALVAGLSRAASRGVIIKGGSVLERLARARILLFDKTGTLTAGRPTLADVVPGPGRRADDILALAASLDQVSPHVLAAAVVRAAQDRGLSLHTPCDVEEVPGQGVRGRVGSSQVTVGKADWVSPGPSAWMAATRRRAERDGMLSIYVAVDGQLAGALLLRDPIRADAVRTVRRLRRDGFTRVIMVTGDGTEAAETVGAVIGVDDVLAERTPAEKVDAVALARKQGPTVMVGDGINDAPALALADVGVAVGARGATVSSETADVVLTVDRLDRLGEAVVISRRALKIATESVAVGMGLSLAAMAVAAAGYLPATWGALTQEGIDVIAMANALRALRMARSYQRLERDDAALARRFSDEHRMLRPALEQVRSAADAVGVVPPEQALLLAHEVHEVLVRDVLPHEEAEDEELYPMLARVLGGQEPTATMSRAHVEIAHLVGRLGRLLGDMDVDAVPEDFTELRRLLYGLDAILQLHFAQEDEGYLSLADDESPPARSGPASVTSSRTATGR